MATASRDGPRFGASCNWEKFSTQPGSGNALSMNTGRPSRRMTIPRARSKNAAGTCKNLTSGKKEANACLTSDRGEADCRVSGKAARRRRGDPSLQKRLVNGEKVGPHRQANGDTGQEGAIPRIDWFPG